MKLHHLKSCPLILSSLHSAVFGILEAKKKKKKDLLPDFINHGILSKTRLFEFQSVVEELVEKNNHDNRNQSITAECDLSQNCPTKFVNNPTCFAALHRLDIIK